MATVDMPMTPTSYLGSVWDYRYFWWSLVSMDVRARYRRSLLGIGWSLLNPIAMTTVLCIVFHRVFKIDIREFGPFLLVGLSFWSFVSSAIMQGCLSFQQAEPYIRQQPAPCVIYPLRTVLGLGFHFLIAFGVAVAFALALLGKGSVVALASLVPAMALLFAFTLAITTIAAFANVFFPDTRHLSEVGLTLLFYMTPIMYPPSVLQGRGLSSLLNFNPLTAMVALVRTPILDGVSASAFAWAYSIAATATAVMIAVALIRSLEHRLVFRL